MIDRSTISAISRPGRYLGCEYNVQSKSWDSAVARFALIFPDLYEIGMSHQGLQILYHLLNRKEGVLAERCYCPDTDLETLLRSTHKPLRSLESQRPLDAFDVLGITLPYELCYTNILTILDLASLPFYSRERDHRYPLVIGGGACALNPEPVADVFDAILLGDGEEAIGDIAELLLDNSFTALARNDQLDRLAEIDGLYVPQHFRPHYDSGGRLTAIEPLRPPRDHVRRRIVSTLDGTEHLKNPLVPNAKIVHNRLGIEVARGCTRGCRFCQAGIIYRPVRERNVATILDLAEHGLGNSGFEELALLSLSTGDYSCLDEALPLLMNRYADEKISVAMPSMRVGTLTPRLMTEIQRVRKTGFTLAPEAGSERLRQVINKGISEDELLAACETAFSLGWQLIKLYFMIGLPTETQADREAIADLLHKVLQTRKQGAAAKRCRVNISVTTFVPKPHTPFQGQKQLSIAESTAFLQHLGEQLPKKGCNYRFHEPRISYLEGVFSRGDRRLTPLLITAWQRGARLDGWSEHFNLDRWQAAAKDCRIDLDQYLESRSPAFPLPWSHLRSGVSDEFLSEELQRAQTRTYTPDCRYHACQQCGLCDFKTIYPRVCNRARKPAMEPIDDQRTVEKEHPVSQNAQHFQYIVHYSRRGTICFLGHLEFMQLILRCLRRGALPLHYSLGFHPTPKVSFGPALAAGSESLDEFFIMDLKAPLNDTEQTRQRLNQMLVPGITITAIGPHSGKMPRKFTADYQLVLPRDLTGEDHRRCQAFIQATSYRIDKTRKGKTRQIDIRPLIPRLTIEPPATIHLTLATEVAQPAIKPVEALCSIFELSEDESHATRILKTSWEPH